MLRLSISNFKCFYDKTLEIKNLTVLAGANGNGKSSIIQSILFLRRTIEHCSYCDDTGYSGRLDINRNVELNGSYCLALGTSKNIIPVDAELGSKMILSICGDNSKISVVYNHDDENNGLWIQPVESELEGNVNNLPILKKEFYYLNAERLGPRIAQRIISHDYPNVGCQGEYCAQILNTYGSIRDFEVEESKLFVNDDKISRSLLKQVQLWLQFLMPDVVVDSVIDNDMLSAQIIVRNGYTMGEHVIATNVGFGISYVLPIIITGLLAKKDSLMIVENPEAHLHPSAQSRIAQFLSKIANSGVYVVVETHSDHFISGVQISSLKQDINHENVNLVYLDKPIGSKEPHLKEISINERGELSEWPIGFFDQTQQDYRDLLILRRKNG